MGNPIAKFMEIDRSYGMWTFNAYFSFLSTVFVFIGSIFLVRSTMRLTPEVMSQLGGTYFGFNPFQLHSLIAQKADTTCGFWLITLGFFLGIMSMLSQKEILPDLLQIFAITSLWIIIGGMIGLALFAHRKIIIWNEREVGRILIGRGIGETAQRGKVIKADINYLRNVADEFSCFHIDGLTNEAVLREGAKFSGRSLPKSLDLTALNSGDHS